MFFLLSDNNKITRIRFCDFKTNKKFNYFFFLIYSPVSAFIVLSLTEFLPVSLLPVLLVVIQMNKYFFTLDLTHRPSQCHVVICHLVFVVNSCMYIPSYYEYLPYYLLNVA